MRRKEYTIEETTPVTEKSKKKRKERVEKRLESGKKTREYEQWRRIGKRADHGAIKVNAPSLHSFYLPFLWWWSLVRPWSGVISVAP